MSLAIHRRGCISFNTAVTLFGLSSRLSCCVHLAYTCMLLIGINSFCLWQARTCPSLGKRKRQTKCAARARTSASDANETAGVYVCTIYRGMLCKYSRYFTITPSGHFNLLRRSLQSVDQGQIFIWRATVKNGLHLYQLHRWGTFFSLFR